MNYKLSKREKTLMYILLLLVIVLSGWFLMVEPSLSEYNQKQTILSEKQMQLSTLKATYADYVDAPAKAVDESAKYLTNKENFYQSMTNEDIDKLMTRMALLHSLKPLSLSIGQSEAANITSYVNSLDEDKNSTSDNEEDTLINKVEISMSLAGDLYNAFALADDIKDSTSMRLKNYSYVRGETVQDSSMVLVFDIYMINE